MHRSGTSFLANWLQSCGLFIGSNLYGEGIGNKNGHFEDWNFIDLHRRALKEGPFAGETENFDFEHHARELVATNNSGHEQWAWKDPRTCLLLQQWHLIIPDATAIIIFRHYTLVVDSIIRRYKEHIKKGNWFLRMFRLFFFYRSRKELHERYLSEWVAYNQQILNYLQKKNRNEYVVVSLDILFASGEKIVSYFNNRGISLHYTDPEQIFNPALFAVNASGKLCFSADKQATADKIFSELAELSKTNCF